MEDEGGVICRQPPPPSKRNPKLARGILSRSLDYSFSADPSRSNVRFQPQPPAASHRPIAGPCHRDLRGRLTRTAPLAAYVHPRPSA